MKRDIFLIGKLDAGLAYNSIKVCSKQDIV
jgi:hypothetical protein